MAHDYSPGVLLQYFSAVFMKKHLADFIATSVDGVKIQLSSGRCIRRVLLMVWTTGLS